MKGLSNYCRWPVEVKEALKHDLYMYLNLLGHRQRWLERLYLDPMGFAELNMTSILDNYRAVKLMSDWEK